VLPDKNKSLNLLVTLPKVCILLPLGIILPVLSNAVFTLALLKYKFVTSVTFAVVKSITLAFNATLELVAYPSVTTLEYTLALLKYRLLPSGTTLVLNVPDVNAHALPL